MSEEKKNTDIQTWGAWDLEDVEKDDRTMNEGATGFLKLPEGRTHIRVLPAPAGKKKPFRVTHVHYISVAGAIAPLKFTCPRYEVKKQCPICDEADKLHRTGNPKDRDRAYDLFAKKRVYCNVINLKEPEKGPQVFELGKKIWDQIVAIRRGGEDGTGGDFTDPVQGFNLVIERSGTSKNDTEYTVLAARKTSQLANMEWIEAQANLESFVRLKTFDEIKKEWGGGGDDDDDEFSAPSGRGGKPQSSKSTDSVKDDAVDADFEDAPT